MVNITASGAVRAGVGGDDRHVGEQCPQCSVPLSSRVLVLSRRLRAMYGLRCAGHARWPRPAGSRLSPGMQAGRSPTAQRAIDLRRWERSDVHEQNRRLAKRTDYDERYQALTRQTATRHGARWSREDDTFLLEHADEPDYRLAQALGRSLRAVRSRPGKLRRHREQHETMSA